MNEPKTFLGDFNKLLAKLRSKEPFAFNRFSDGELIILQNKELILGQGIIKIGDNITPGPYQKEDFKHYNPSEHQFFRNKLLESFRFRKKNYYKGISCRCCVGDSGVQDQLVFLSEGLNDEFLTWSNLMVNSNYPRFISNFYPEFYNYEVVIVCNEAANLSNMPFVVKDFRVGYNAFVNNYGLIEEIKRWISDNNIRNKLFLFSASAFSKMAIHQLYDFSGSNTYIDIGTTLNPLMKLRLDRSYLRSYWLGSNEQDINRVCIW